jgi:hypothetical protein
MYDRGDAVPSFLLVLLIHLFGVQIQFSSFLLLFVTYVARVCASGLDDRASFPASRPTRIVLVIGLEPLCVNSARPAIRGTERKADL